LAVTSVSLVGLAVASASFGELAVTSVSLVGPVMVIVVFS
jgi:hypothetical protein